jgi:fructuronate reductase
VTRLALATASALPPDVARPGFDPATLETGIVHLGIGAFHRGHMAAYTQDALTQRPGDWGITGVSLRSPDIRDRLAPQDGLYTLVERSPAGERLTLIGTVREVLVAPEDPARVIARIADPKTRIVSLTVTEKGYCHDPATGRLREDDPEIRHDLTVPDAPRTTIGVLVRALARRRAAGAPLTILSCDNLPHNGATLAGIVGRFAELVDPALARWIAESIAFPSTMIDRIVPATTDADRTAVAARLGLEDAAPVLVEPFRQWVIEDRFVAGRPAWDSVGAELVADVAPFEAMKLRLLNATHSGMAYLGFLAGFEFIYQVIAEPAFRRFVERLMREEAAPTLRLPSGVDLAAYQEALVERFANPALGHRCAQIAMDGSQKLPQRLLGTIRDRLAAGASIDHLALAVAAWQRYIRGIDEQGRAYTVSDPLAEKLVQVDREAGPDPRAKVDALLGVRAVFGDDLRQSDALRAALARHLAALDREGALATVRNHYAD